MKRLIAALLAMALLSGQISWAAASDSASASESENLKVVREIKIRGIRNFKERTVRDLIKTRPRDYYSQVAIREDIQAILASGNFEDAEVETADLATGGLRVTFKVKERQMIRKIDFVGAKKISRGKLKDEISLHAKEGFDPAKLENDKQKILTLYAEKGYPDAKVEAFTTFQEDLGQVSINFVVKEGNRILIELVEFEGNTVFTTKKLRRLMKMKKRKVYSQEKLDKDREEIEHFYKNNGYATAKTLDPKITYNADRTKLQLLIPIQEGKRYTVSTFEFTGYTVYKLPELTKAVTLEKGKLFNQEKHDQSLANLREMYLEKGYLYSRINAKEIRDDEKGEIKYIFEIDEGTIVYIDRIFIEGNRKTKEKVFRREILLKPGDPFSSSKIRKSQEKIFNLGFIDDVKPDIQPARDPDKADLVMEIVEGKPGSLSAGAAYSSTDGLIGQLQLAHSNLFGLAQKLNLTWEFGARRQNYEINWTEPWFKDRPISFGLDAYNTVRDRLFDADSTPDYTETRRGAGVRVGPRFSEIYTLQFSYSLANIQISNVDSRFKSQITEGINTNSAFTTELIRDTRDYYFDAARGNRNSISVQFTGGPVLQGDTHLVKSILSSSWFLTMFEVAPNYPWVFSVNMRGGAAQEYSPSTTVPIFERFFVGGADSVRGYLSRGEIGPEEGGRVFTVENAEIKIPLYAEGKRRILQFVLFADAGGAWISAKDFRLAFGQSVNNAENANFLKASVGAGVRITTPVFPIRLDWGYGLNHRGNEDNTQIHFTLGNLF